MIVIESRRKSEATLARLWPDCPIIDVTSKGADPWVQFSPFYPHGNIPIPGSAGTGQSVEGIWQGLKVFEKEGIDPQKWAITNMKGIKRSGSSRGKVLGHQFDGNLLGYRDARVKIYLPVYRWVLEHKLTKQIEQLRALNTQTLVLLDYETNGDINDLTKPLSHASLVKAFIEGNWPE